MLGRKRISVIKAKLGYRENAAIRVAEPVARIKEAPQPGAGTPGQVGRLPTHLVAHLGTTAGSHSPLTRDPSWGLNLSFLFPLLDHPGLPSPLPTLHIPLRVQLGRWGVDWCRKWSVLHHCAVLWDMPRCLLCQTRAGEIWGIYSAPGPINLEGRFLNGLKQMDQSEDAEPDQGACPLGPGNKGGPRLADLSVSTREPLSMRTSSTKGVVGL